MSMFILFFIPICVASGSGKMEVFMKIAVCEDTASDSAKLYAYIDDYCKQHCYDGQIVAFETGEALLDAFSPGAFDLIFLDIIMPGLSGMDVAQKIRETDRDCSLVFVTVSEDYSMDGFLVQAKGYVVKPLDQKKMDDVMHALRRDFDSNSRLIEIPICGENIMVSIADLLYAEVYDKKAVFHMQRGKLTARLPLGELEARLGGTPFLRCHRSYIINMNYVDDMWASDFLMRNGDIVPMRINGRKEVRMAMAKFTAKSPLEVS